MAVHVGSCIEWWSRMKAGLEMLKGQLPKVVRDGPGSLLTGDVNDGWNDIADQFALYVYKVIPRPPRYVPGMLIYLMYIIDESSSGRLLPLH